MRRPHRFTGHHMEGVQSHQTVEVLCADGERRSICICLISAEDINDEGQVEWPTKELEKRSVRM